MNQFDFRPPKRVAVKCAIYCHGNAIARAMCLVCRVGLCKRHAIVVNGRTYCKEHRPGYREA